MIPGNLSPPGGPVAGQMLGRYRIEETLGEGGMGLVFRATDTTDGSVVALKVLRPGLSQDATFRQRFDHEARAARGATSRHLVPLLEAAEIDGYQVIAFRYIAGGSLEDRLHDGPLQAGAFVRLIGEVAQGLDALHAQGVVHRDVKPSNVLIDQDGSALLTDFGLAKGADFTALTMPQQVLGTTNYLAPEVIRGAPATPASDIYGLGCVAFECIAGAAPFAHRNVFAIATAHLQDAPPDPCAGRPELPRDLSWALLRALAKAPAERPPTATAYARMLRLALEGEGQR